MVLNFFYNMVLYSNTFKSNNYVTTSPHQRCSLCLQISLTVTGNFCFLEHFICVVYFLGSVID